MAGIAIPGRSTYNTWTDEWEGFQSYTLTL